MAPKTKRNPYICACGFETRITSEWRKHLLLSSKKDGKGVHFGVHPDAVKKTIEDTAAYLSMNTTPLITQPSDNITEAEVTTLEKSVGNLKTANKQKCIVFRPRYHGGWGYENLDTSQMDTSDCMWYRYGQHYPVFYEHSNGKGPEFVPVTDFDKIGERPSDLFDAQNSSSYKKVLKPRMSGLEKLRLGVMVVLIIVMVLALYVFSQGPLGGA